MMQKKRLLNNDDKNYLWKTYVNNHFQFLSRDELSRIAYERDRSLDVVYKNLRKLIALHNGVPVEQALDNPFTPAEDSTILQAYTENITDSYQSESTIVQDLSANLRRDCNRLLWLKEQQKRAERSFDANVALYKGSHRGVMPDVRKFPYSEIEDDVVLSAYTHNAAAVKASIEAARTLQIVTLGGASNEFIFPLLAEHHPELEELHLEKREHDLFNALVSYLPGARSLRKISSNKVLPDAVLQALSANCVHLEILKMDTVYDCTGIASDEGVIALAREGKQNSHTLH